MVRLYLTVWLVLAALQLWPQQKKSNPVRYSASDSVQRQISSQYELRSFVHRMIMGKNYRPTWSRPVTLPVFHFSKSGFKIEKLGGGEQTKSLRLKDGAGEDWVLRTVDKNVEPAVPKPLQNTLAEKIVQDMISASYPYGHIIVGKLSKAAGLAAPLPEMYFIADDAALGPYRSIFANTVCTLEQLEPTPDGSETEETEDILQKLNQSDRGVMQKEFLRIRLMDVLVGDWDRHTGQLRWGNFDSSGITYYYAIPRDRDNAFFYSNGLLPTVARWTFMPHLTGFKKTSANTLAIRIISWAWEPLFLNELDAAAWQQEIRDFQRSITDSVIEQTIATLPPAVIAMDGSELIRKLKQRRDGLAENGMRYYRFLSRHVTINGSQGEDLFVVHSAKDRLRVTVYQSNKQQQKVKIYDRVFLPSETSFIYLNGLKGKDRFEVDAVSRPRIRLEVHGNEGKDTFELNGRVNTKNIYSDPEDSVRINQRG